MPITVVQEPPATIVVRSPGPQGPAATGSFVPVPDAADDTGAAGAMAYDNDYLYVCVATNTWRRTPLAEWE